jgi:hypothetical protein
MAYCLKREFDERGRNREQYDYLSAKLKKTIRAASVKPIVTSLPTTHRLSCSGRNFGRNFADIENAGQSGPNRCVRPESQAIPQPAETVVKVIPVNSGQADLNLLVETPFLARLGALRN